MKVNLSFGAIVGIGVVALGGLLVWRASSAASSAGDAIMNAFRQGAEAAKQAAAEAVDAVNPMSTNNLAYRGVNAGLTAAAGSPTYASDALFAVFNADARQAERDMLDPLPQVTVYDLEDMEDGLARRAATVTPGGAFIGYGHAFGRRR